MEKKKATEFFSSIRSGLGVFHPSDENAERILSWLMPRIRTEELKQSIYYYSKWTLTGEQKWYDLWDPVRGLFLGTNTLYKHEKFIRRKGREWWPYIQRYIANPQWIIKYITDRNPDTKQALGTALGKAYVADYSKKLYVFFEMWFFKFPRYHNGCGGIMKYGIIQADLNQVGFFCNVCGFRCTVETVEANSYQQRKYA